MDLKDLFPFLKLLMCFIIAESLWPTCLSLDILLTGLDLGEILAAETD